MSYTNFTIETDADGIALVTWNMPDKSMNVFTAEVMKELDAIVDQTVADEAVKGVVFTSGKSTFSGGADLSMIKGMFTFQQEQKKLDPENAAQKLFDLTGQMTGLFRKLETSGKPWVSAINGTCMGGAFELSLACHGRVAANSKSVKIALPEVKVGIFPGAGGTQRVPRLTNAQDALQMMTTGSSLTPQRAKAMGLIHEIAEPAELINAAKAMIKNGLKPVQPWDEKGYKVPGGGIWTPAAAQLWPAASAILRRETAGNYPGGLAILKCVYEGLQVPFDTGLKIEQRYFTEILQTTEAFSMIRSLFISMQELGKGARRPAGIPKSELKQIGVVGAGFMGASIAYVAAAAGIEVTLIDRDMEAAEKGKAHSEGLVKDSIGKGRLTHDEATALLARITPSADYNDLKDVKLVVEAVFEDRQVKKDVIEKVEAVLAEDAIFAS
ncbi:MAG: FAD-dependent oxidoreductase, partial [Rhizobium giardinii]